MSKYRAVKDKQTGKWFVEKLEPFFDLPILLAITGSRANAYAMIECIRTGAPHQQSYTVGL